MGYANKGLREGIEREEVGGTGCERWDMTESQFCLLTSLAPLTDCQTGGCACRRGRKGKMFVPGGNKVEKGNGRREDSIAGRREGVGITGKLVEGGQGEGGRGHLQSQQWGRFYSPPGL